MAALRVKQRVREEHEHMVRAVACLEDTIRKQAIDCDYKRRGFLNAISPGLIADRNGTAAHRGPRMVDTV
jgi:hypothetical protein